MWLLSGLLLSFVLGRTQAQSLSCSILDADGCCSYACQLAICQTLYSSGLQLGAADPAFWLNRTGWEAVYTFSGPANAACQQYLKASTASADQPAYCTWHGISCNATAYSACSQSRWSHGVTNITLTNNNLTGNISDSFATDMKQLHDCGLQSLVIGGASFQLHGTISAQFGELTQLTTLSIFGTNISGKIPAELGNMTALEVLDLNTDYLTGTIPPELGRLSKLRRLNLAYNGWTDKGEMLNGNFSARWLSMSSIEVLMLDHNALNGTLPDDLCTRLTRLKALSLGNNHFSGNATQFGNCSQLSILDLSPEGLKEMMGLISFYKENARILKDTFTDMGFEVYGGDDAPYVWVGFPGKPSWDVFAEILEKCNIVTTPGSGFGPAGEGFVRASAFGSRDNILEAVRRFKDVYGKQ